jgi:hypothetical protein
MDNNGSKMMHNIFEAFFPVTDIQMARKDVFDYINGNMCHHLNITYWIYDNVEDKSARMKELLDKYLDGEILKLEENEPLSFELII